MDRTINMFERNKELSGASPSGRWEMKPETGYNFYQTYLWLKEADKELMNRLGQL